MCACVTGVVAYGLFDLTWLEAFLLGAVVASTDAAAVFSTLRFTHISRRLAGMLEAESGGNDPMAIALTLGLIVDRTSAVARLRRPGRAGRTPDQHRSRRRGHPRGRCRLGVCSDPGADRRLRPGGVDRGGRALVRGRRHPRWERVSCRLSRWACRGKHAVSVQTAARGVSRGPGLRRRRSACSCCSACWCSLTSCPMSRCPGSRWRWRSCLSRGRRPCGYRPLSPTIRLGTVSCLVGQGCEGARRSSSRRSCSIRCPA